MIWPKSSGVVLLLVCCISSPTSSVNCNRQKRCKTAKIHGLKTSDCYGMDWKEFPKCLSSDVEVIDLSYNRIRKITKSDIQQYPSIKHLYLAENLIANVDDETFRDLSSLETLDLSVNAVGKVPPSIFQLPSLKTLYLSQNSNINLSESIAEAKPIASPLTKIDISYNSEEGKFTDFPDFGVMPFLAFLNISGDQFNSLSTKHFAGLCKLQILINVNVTAIFKNACDCWEINQWLKERNVAFTPFSCSGREEECLDLNKEDLATYETCSENVKQIEHKIFVTKLGIGIGIAVAVIVIVGMLVLWIYMKNRKEKRAVQIRSSVLLQDNDNLLQNQSNF